MRQISFDTGREKHHWNKIFEYFSIFLFKIFSSRFNTYLLQWLNSDPNPCSSSVYGIASSARVVAVLMVKMSLKKHPFNFSLNFGYIERNCTKPNQVNTPDYSTHRLDFKPKIEKQWVRCDSLHYLWITIFGSNRQLTSTSLKIHISYQIRKYTFLVNFKFIQTFYILP